jgi:hypothetical protein
MDAERFEHVVRALTMSPSRRQALGGVMGAILGGVLGNASPVRAGKGKKGKAGKGKKKKQGTPGTVPLSPPPCVGACAGKPCGADNGCGVPCGCAAGETCAAADAYDNVNCSSSSCAFVECVPDTCADASCCAGNASCGGISTQGLCCTEGLFAYCRCESTPGAGDGRFGCCAPGNCPTSADSAVGDAAGLPDESGECLAGVSRFATCS